MNTNTVGGFTLQGTARNTWPNQTVATTTETILQINTDGSATNFFLTPTLPTTVVGAQTPFATASNPSITTRGGQQYGLPSGWSNQGWNTNVLLPGRVFKVRIVGTGNAGANADQTLVVNLYQGTSATVGDDNKIGTTGTAFAAAAGGAFNFYVEAKLLWDATSEILAGSYEASINFGSAAQYTAPKALDSTTAFTSVTASGLSFLATLTLGNAASSTINVSEFVLESV